MTCAMLDLKKCDKKKGRKKANVDKQNVIDMK